MGDVVHGIVRNGGRLPQSLQGGGDRCGGGGVRRGGCWCRLLARIREQLRAQPLGPGTEDLLVTM